MPPLLKEKDIEPVPAATPVQPASAAATTPPDAITGDAPDAEVPPPSGTADRDQDWSELRAELHNLRTDLARSTSRITRSITVTGLSLTAVVLLGTLGAGMIMGPHAEHVPAPVAADTRSSAALNAEIARLERLVADLGSRQEKSRDTAATAGATSSAEAARDLDCAKLPDNVGTYSADVSIQFQVGKADILPASTGTLNTIAKFLALIPDRCVLIEGHTDASGKEDKNLALSRNRAAAVARYLAERPGVQQNRLVPLGKGSSNPVEGVDSRDPQNRRVVFKVAHR